MARISIFGIGYVGVVAAACLARDGHIVTAVDIDPAKIDAINAGRCPIVEPGLADLIATAVAEGRLRATADATAAVHGSDASFICVGTPSAPDGSVGLGQVHAACRAIGAALATAPGFHSVVIRSTMVPGSTDGACIPTLETASGKVAGRDFGIGYFPEFLRESTAIRDYDDPGLIVFGARDDATAALLAELNTRLPAEMQVTDIRTAELVKYTSNAWRAVKVSFANEIGNIAKGCSLDGQEVMRILCADRKISLSSHFMRPGFAFGGSCLPKDVRALRHLARDRGVTSPVLDAVLAANAAQIARAEAMIGASGARSVGMVGIAFKPGTDDLRESPLAELAARLIGRGVDVSVYDPCVRTAFACAAAAGATGRGNDVLPDLQRRLVAGLDDLLAGSEAIVVGNLYAEAVDPLCAALSDRPVIDLTRLQPGRISAGEYQGICW